MRVASIKCGTKRRTTAATTSGLDGSIVQEAQGDHAAAAVGHIVVSVDFFPAAQHLPSPLKHDAVLGKDFELNAAGLVAWLEREAA